MAEPNVWAYVACEQCRCTEFVVLLHKRLESMSVKCKLCKAELLVAERRGTASPAAAIP